jgi:hypothetical protein
MMVWESAPPFLLLRSLADIDARHDAMATRERFEACVSYLLSYCGAQRQIKAGAGDAHI